MTSINYTKYKLIFLFIAGMFYILFLGNVHLFDWDEINFAEAAREMIVTGDYLNVRIDFEPFHEKPPLYIWMQVIAMKIFGISEFAARLPNAVFGILTLSLFMKIGKNEFDDDFGFLWALAYFGSLLPHFYFKSSIIDPVFNYFMFAGIYYLYQFTKYNITDNKNIVLYIIRAAIFTALAIMTKGPVGFLLVFITWAVFWLFNTKKFKLPLKEIVIFSIISFIPALIWYLLIFLQQGSGLIGEFIQYQIRLLTTGDAGHEGPFYYHFLVVFLGCFPSSIFIFKSFGKNANDSQHQIIFKYFNIILLSVVLIIFSLVKTKIVHYSSLAYFPVTFLSAYYIHKILKGEYKISKVTNIILLLIGSIISLMFILFPLVLMNIKSFLPQITDKLTNALLQAEVKWSGFELIVGIILIAGLITYLVFIIKNQYRNAIYALFGSVAITMFLFLPIMAPKIEIYTQGAPIEFFQNLADEDVYVYTLGYKSYAHYFYQRKKFENSKYSMKLSGKDYEEFLLTGDIKKPVYFSAKINNYDEYLIRQPKLIELYRKNGFIFFVRNTNN